jgi:hypothetical protein
MLTGPGADVPVPSPVACVVAVAEGLASKRCAPGLLFPGCVVKGSWVRVGILAFSAVAASPGSAVACVVVAGIAADVCIAALSEVSATWSSLSLAVAGSGHVSAVALVASAIVVGAAVAPAWAGAVELAVALFAKRLACNASFRVRIGDGKRRPVLPAM